MAFYRIPFNVRDISLDDGKILEVVLGLRLQLNNFLKEMPSCAFVCYCCVPS
jgi:hypothetical protein